ncbi:MAG: PIG-L family deacetylase [Planctomycetes bacterium]|nr:PIG-L family deacetylase [Planctomycetota bacterium]
METIVVLAAHPDDVAACMGGTLLKLRGAARVHVLCATRGERGCPGRDMDEVAKIREAEERAACEVLGAEVTFLDRIDAEVLADAAIIARVESELERLRPAALFTLWPVDRHPDHSAVSEIARKAAGTGEARCPIVYYESALSCQVSQFHPDVYVDVTDVWDEKLRAVRCHDCQNVGDELAAFTTQQCVFRGWESGCRYAEAFKTTRPLKMEPDALLAHLAWTRKTYPRF